jgi:hypothetical protein
MTLFSLASTQRVKSSMFAVLILVALTLCAWPEARIFAADFPDNERSVSGTVVPSRGTTPGPSLSQTKPAPQPWSDNANSRSLAAQPDQRCTMLRKRYAQSQACFARFRMKNHGLRPGAFKQCKQMKDPSSDCGPPVNP